MHTRRPGLFLTGLLAGALLGTALVPSSPAAHAATGLEGWDPGNIISDANMYGSAVASSLSDQQIQDFLNEKGANCVGGPDGSDCLKDATFTTNTVPASQWCTGAYEGAANESAASIIGKAARACEISPKVLLVLLQKEQGLVTTTSPTATKYAKATGFGCPDGQPCKNQFAGFPQQVYSAASRLQQYRLQPNSFNFRAGMTTTVRFNPNASCGGQSVSIANAATAGLYNYTPFVPNKAALDAVAGTGDACSAYGNRNFYRYHSLWFGQPNVGAPAPAPQTPADPVEPPKQVGRPAEPAKPAPEGPKVLTDTATRPKQDLTGDNRGDILVNKDGRAHIVEPSVPSGDRTTSTITTGERSGWGWNPTRTIGVGDWDGDSSADLVSWRANGILVQYRLRDGQWQPARQIGRGWNGFDAVFGGSDWDGDAKPDLLARSAHNGDLHLYPSNGRGGFEAPRKVGAGWQGLTNLSIVPAYTGGRPAVTAVDQQGRLRIYEGDGRGGFTANSILGPGWNVMTSLAGVADHNGDGRGDIVAAARTGELYLYVTNATTLTRTAANNQVERVSTLAPTGTAGGNRLYGATPTGTIHSVDLASTTVAGQRPARDTGIAMSDGDQVMPVGLWDHDNHADIIKVSADGRVTLHRGNANGGFSGGEEIASGWAYTQVIPVMGWAGNDQPGLVGWNQSTGDVVLHSAEGTGAITAPVTIGKNLTWADRIVDGGNWSGAPGPQLLARRASDGALMRIASTTAGLTIDQPHQIGRGWAGLDVFSLGDMNGDGRDDLVLKASDGVLTLYTGNGADGFGPITNLGR